VPIRRRRSLGSNNRLFGSRQFEAAGRSARRAKGPPQCLGQAGSQIRQRARIGEDRALRVAPLGLKQIARQRDLRMRLLRQRRQPGDRVGDDLLDRRALVNDAVDERCIGAVFVAAAAPDRRADPRARPTGA